ncbi:hypothetical protein T440DRAFT_147921 [Plenodomus tracheiphilus IPT5]|uniref:Uncharacterized protein n=1 Tax=Plenodomus tracheiphilus IPT5 TaxID=1408161 RepID=A0A6A7B334_9PLEO|nr:hypothetical protein T440DRAFT_147921 [Plenodomus tracheiphilus IPT5]
MLSMRRSRSSRNTAHLPHTTERGRCGPGRHGALGDKAEARGVRGKDSVDLCGTRPSFSVSDSAWKLGRWFATLRLVELVAFFTCCCICSEDSVTVTGTVLWCGGAEPRS